VVAQPLTPALGSIDIFLDCAKPPARYRPHASSAPHEALQVIKSVVWDGGNALNCAAGLLQDLIIIHKLAPEIRPCHSGRAVRFAGTFIEFSSFLSAHTRALSSRRIGQAAVTLHLTSVLA
jgi:hypothetical protein